MRATVHDRSKGFQQGRWAGATCLCLRSQRHHVDWDDAFACSMRAGYFRDGISDKLSVRTLGNLTGVSQGGLNSRAFVYDSVSELTSATNPESATQYFYTDVSAALCSGRVSDVVPPNGRSRDNNHLSIRPDQPHSGEVLYRWHTRSYVYIRTLLRLADWVLLC